MRTCVLIGGLVVAALGCGEDFVVAADGSGGASSVAVTTTASGGGGGVAASGPATTVGPTDLPPQPLIDEGLVVRYFLDEGADRAGAEDAASDPLNLTLKYAGSLQFDGVVGRRGLRWASSGEDGAALAPIDDTKVYKLLEGATQMTLELVTTVEAVDSQNSRLLVINTGTNTGRLGFIAGSIDRVGFVLNETAYSFEKNWVDDGRTVLHAVVDTTRETDRLRLYSNGQQLTAFAGEPPQGQALALLSGRSLVIGNRDIGQRSIEGITSYAAIYRQAFDATRVQTHVDALLANDDTP